MVVYAHALYPLLILLAARLWPASVRKQDVRPPVSLVIVARNEAACIGEKLRNVLERAVRFYRDGLGLNVPAEFKGHDGFDGIMVRILAVCEEREHENPPEIRQHLSDSTPTPIRPCRFPGPPATSQGRRGPPAWSGGGQTRPRSPAACPPPAPSR